MKRYSAFGLGHAMFSIFVTMSVYGMGCSAGDIDEAADLEEVNVRAAEQYAGVGGDPGTHNHLRPKCFWDDSFQQTARDLANAPLVDADGVLPAMPYMEYISLECRQELLEVLVSCALDEGREAIDKEDGNRVYVGELGFGARWLDDKLDTKGRERVTGCMIERLNAFGIKMELYLYSDPDFPADPVGMHLYPVTESQGWGNMFDSTEILNPTHEPGIQTRAPFNAYICQDAGLYECTVAGFIYTFGRVCDNGSTTCGLQAMGPCSTTCPHQDPSLCPMWERRMFASTPDGKFCDEQR